MMGGLFSEIVEKEGCQFSNTLFLEIFVFSFDILQQARCRQAIRLETDNHGGLNEHMTFVTNNKEAILINHAY